MMMKCVFVPKATAWQIICIRNLVRRTKNKMTRRATSPTDSQTYDVSVRLLWSVSLYYYYLYRVDDNDFDVLMNIVMMITLIKKKKKKSVSVLKKSRWKGVRHQTTLFLLLFFLCIVIWMKIRVISASCPLDTQSSQQHQMQYIIEPHVLTPRVERHEEIEFSLQHFVIQRHRSLEQSH